MNVNGKHKLTGCISLAPVHCTWTSGIDGRPPAPEEPSRSPSLFRPRSGCLGHRAPCPTWSHKDRQEKVSKWGHQYKSPNSFETSSKPLSLHWLIQYKILLSLGGQKKKNCFELKIYGTFLIPLQLQYLNMILIFYKIILI